MNGKGNNIKPKVLYVDDDPEMLELFKLSFIDLLDTICIDEPEEALDLIGKEEFDTVLTDFDMPDMNGLKLLSEIKNTKPDLPVIFYTGQGSEEVAREAFIRGASDYFVKEPGEFFHKEKIVNSVNRAMEITKEKRERKRTEEALQIYATVFKTIPSGVTIYQYKEPDHLFLLNSNPITLKHAGIEEEDVIGKE
ncbi:MAG: response regulator, partial [Firmicutes bacterium]|nr:response regulator [Bacillota bacterium]